MTLHLRSVSQTTITFIGVACFVVPATAQTPSRFDGVYSGSNISTGGFKCPTTARPGAKPWQQVKIENGIAYLTIKSPMGTLDAMQAPVDASGNFVMHPTQAAFANNHYDGHADGRTVTVAHGGNCVTTETWTKQ